MAPGAFYRRERGARDFTRILGPVPTGRSSPHILDILNSLQGQQVRFEFFDTGGPNRFAGDNSGGGALHVIMPVRVP
jgi:hypothetical protein